MLVTDSAYCNPDIILSLQKQGGVDLFGFKSTEGNDTLDEQWEINIAKAKAANYPFFAWHYDNPMQTAQSQLDWFVKHNCHKSGALFYALDVEDQTDYNGKTLAPDALFYHIVDLCNKFSTLHMPWIFYSRKSWIDDYCPRLWPFLKDKFLWMASYPYIALPQQMLKQTVTTTWEEFKTKYVSKLGNYVLPGYDTVLWQFTGDTFCLPGGGKNWKGIQTPLDVSTTQYDLAGLLAHIGVNPPPVNPAPPISQTPVWDTLTTTSQMELIHQHLKKSGEVL
jgi:hypothetical protein